MRIAIGLVIFLTWLSAAAHAQTFHIMPMGNERNDSADYISAECETDAKQQTMTCDFTQVALYPETTSEMADARIKKLIGEFTPTEAKEVQKACPTLDDEMQKLRVKLATPDASINKALLPYAKRWLEAMDAVCNNPSRENYEALQRAIIAADTETCKIWVTRWKTTFARQTETKWVANDGPNGICGIVLISTLERDGKSNSFWKYNQRRIVTNKEIKEPLPCHEWDERPSAYAFGVGAKKLACELVQAGAFQ
jgi:hypothetical protein